MDFKQWLLEMVFFFRIDRKGGFGIVVFRNRGGQWFIERSAGL
jgi:hypothetical protein